MQQSLGKLYFFAGKMGAGKSTYSLHLAQEVNAVHISEDEWLSILYPDLIDNFEDYLKFASRIKPLMFTHVKNILQSGANVVLDFPANTQKQREWFARLIEAASVEHELVFIDVDDQTCLERIKQRSIECPERAQFDTESMFLYVTQYFEAPQDKEGFIIRLIANHG